MLPLAVVAYPALLLTPTTVSGSPGNTQISRLIVATVTVRPHETESIALDFGG